LNNEPNTSAAPRPVRIDKWLWAVRVYKTRAQAAAACRGGLVKVGGAPVKPSRDVKIGDVIEARAGDITRTLKARGLVERRVGAAVAAGFFEDLTPESERNKPREAALQPTFVRPRGAGRPTKKDRRRIESLEEGL
jgi:ribosome-associated heat shock protein Hsp15